uniref:KRAB domain-containing protein n=1 Tax=Chelonoidis abingdonii TaxID=106734 RepID=A0A8C0H1B0_CHEAB
MGREYLFQVPVTLEDVAVYFIKKDWSRLDKRQRELYRNVMIFMGKVSFIIRIMISKPDVISCMEQGEETCFPNLQVSVDRVIPRGFSTGEE